MPRLTNSTPKYRKHRASGQAVVTLNGKDHYLGPHNTKSSKTEYDRLIGEWLANDRRPPTAASGGKDTTVVELLAAFWSHATAYYVDSDGKPNREAKNYRTLIKRLKAYCGSTPVSELRPLRLKAFRQTLVDAELARSNVNHTMNRLRHIVKWGVENELVSAALLADLKCVAPLRYGKTEAKETEPVKPVHDAYVDAIREHVPRQIWAIIELQRLAGMRGGEVCLMRTRDINTQGEVWTYEPASHKTRYRGHSRIVHLGPRAQAIVREWLRVELDEYLFQPIEAEVERRAKQHANRKTPLKYGNSPGTNRKRKPSKTPGDRYTPDSYRRAIKYGIRKANRQRAAAGECEIPKWHPHQLRHNAATWLRKEFGLDVARVVLGHRSAQVTEVYAELDRDKAREAMGQVG